jgi:G3E family GTPase
MGRPRIPVTLVTGFLGAGKSTLLARVLCDAHPRRIAVIENELADVGVDQRLLVGEAGEIVALAGGCVCCSARGDLLGAVRQVASGEFPPDAIVIETSGIARPSATAADLIELGASERQIWLRAIVVVVDAANAARDSGRGEFIDQIVHADVVLLTKGDLVEANILRGAREVVRGINPGAEIRLAPLAGSNDVLGAALDRTESAFVPAPGAYALGHDIEAISVELPASLDGDRLDAELSALAGDPAVIRVKGFVKVGDDVQLVQGVHGIVDTLPWPSVSSDALALVIIGECLNERGLRHRLEACAISS